MNQELQLLIFHYVLSHPDICDKCQPEFFNLTYLKELFKIAKEQVMKYRSEINAEQMVQCINVSDISPEVRNYLSPTLISQIWQVKSTLHNYDEEWLLNSTKAFISWQTLVAGIQKTVHYIKTVENDLTIDNFQDLVDRARYTLTQDTGVEFVNNTKGVSLYDVEAHRTKELNRWSTGFPFLDRASKGGYWGGSLWVFMGAPKAGKSRLLQNLAAQSIKRGDNCAYASFELQEEIITQRMGSNLFNIKMDDYDLVAQDENLMSQKIKAFLNQTGNVFAQKPGYLDIKSFPTSAFSVQDLELWLLKEQERLAVETGNPNFKFKNIFVDYLNIMKNWRNPNSENTYLKIKQIAEDLRAMAMKNNWCVITVTQVKQSFFNSSDMDMTSAAESSALAATVDMMLAIITDVMMQAAHYLYLKSILSRVTPFINERKKYNIEECYMRLVETNEPIIHDEEMMENFVKKSNEITKNYNSQSSSTLVAPTPIMQPAIPTPTANLSATEVTQENLLQTIGII